MIIASKPQSRGTEDEILLEQKITHTATLLLTPEGGRTGYPIETSFRYFIKKGRRSSQELSFLYVSDEDAKGDRLCAAFPIESTNLWVGVKQPAYDYKEKSVVPGRAHNFKTEQFSVVVFSPERIVRQYKVDAVLNGARFNKSPNSDLIRFWRNEGWASLDLTSGMVRPDPSRIPETAPNHKSVTIPGTGWRIVFDLPPFATTEESLADHSYTFRGNTNSDDRMIGGAGLGVMIQYGWIWFKSYKSRADLLSYHFDKPPKNLRHTEQYDRVEKINPARPDFAGVKEVLFLSEISGQPLEISLYVSAPFERWDEIIARFDSTLTIEHVNSEAD